MHSNTEPEFEGCEAPLWLAPSEIISEIFEFKMVTISAGGNTFSKATNFANFAKLNFPHFSAFRHESLLFLLVVNFALSITVVIASFFFKWIKEFSFIYFVNCPLSTTFTIRQI